MKHRGEHRVGSLMAGHVDERDPRRPAAAIKVRRDVRPPGLLSHLDTGFQVVALLEIHVDEVVAAYDAVQWKRLTVDLHPNERRNAPRPGHDSPGDFFKIFELSRKLFSRASDDGSIPLIPSFTLDAPDGASGVRRPQRISAHGPRNRYPVLTGFLAGRRQICPTALQQPDLQALVCLISPKKGINIREHCSQVPINPHRGRWPSG